MGHSSLFHPIPDYSIKWSWEGDEWSQEGVGWFLEGVKWFWQGFIWFWEGVRWSWECLGKMSRCLGMVSDVLEQSQIKKRTLKLVSSINIARDATTVRKNNNPFPSLGNKKPSYDKV